MEIILQSSTLKSLYQLLYDVNCLEDLAVQKVKYKGKSN